MDVQGPGMPRTNTRPGQAQEDNGNGGNLLPRGISGP